MIKYPVRVDKIKVRDGLAEGNYTTYYLVLDNNDNRVCDSIQKESANTIANALNAIHELEGKPMSCLWSYNITDWWNKYIHKNMYT